RSIRRTGLSRSKNNPDGLIQGSYQCFLCGDRRGSGLQYRSVFDMAASVSHFSSSKANRHKSARKLSGGHRPPLKKPRTPSCDENIQPEGMHSNLFVGFGWAIARACHQVWKQDRYSASRSSVRKFEHPSLKPDATFFKCRNAGWSPFSMVEDSDLWVR